jgi:glyoxylase-like metal-dependent hydrolase (beta-lactamase superfamily II)
MTWRIAVGSGRFEPINLAAGISGLNRIDAPDALIAGVRQAEHGRVQAGIDDWRGPDPHAHVHLLAVPNDGMMEGQPTNCYLLGYVVDGGPLTVVDCGSDDALPTWRTAFETSGIDPSRVQRIILTHAHPDHAGAGAALKALTGATVHVSPLEREQVQHWAPALEIDGWLEHDTPLELAGGTLQPIFTPGHAPGHLCFVDSETGVLLAGDIVSGFGSVGIFPPNGSMAAYLDSLRTLLEIHQRQPFSAILPGHGPLIPDPAGKLQETLDRRLSREREILVLLAEHGPLTVDQLMPLIYTEILPHLVYAGKATLTMHLEKLVVDGLVLLGDDGYNLV